MTAVWPPSLPQDVLVQGYDEALAENVVRTTMDAGPAKVRRRFTAGVRNFRLTVYLTRTQTDTLESFFDTTVKDGSLPFDWTHPRKQTSVTFRFVTPPRFHPDGSGARWLTTLDLEVLP